jgi:hypothetical protein
MMWGLGKELIVPQSDSPGLFGGINKLSSRNLQHAMQLTSIIRNNCVNEKGTLVFNACKSD